MKRNPGKQYSGAALRAARVQREQARVDPSVEAKRREDGFLRSMSGAREDYDWLIANQGWTLLGFDTFAEWYAERIAPTMAALGGRPVPELASDVLARIRADEENLPKPQRRTAAELAALVGVSEWKVRSRQDHRTRRTTSTADLDGEIVETPGADHAPVEGESPSEGDWPAPDRTAVDAGESASADGGEGVIHSPVDPPAAGVDAEGVDAGGNPTDSSAALAFPSDQSALVAEQPRSDSPVAPGEAPSPDGVQPPAGPVGEEPESFEPAAPEEPANSSGAQNITEEQTPYSPSELFLSPSGAVGVADGDQVEEEPDAGPLGSSSTDPAADWMSMWRRLIGGVTTVEKDFTDEDLDEVWDDLITLNERLFAGRQS